MDMEQNPKTAFLLLREKQGCNMQLLLAFAHNAVSVLGNSLFLIFLESSSSTSQDKAEMKALRKQAGFFLAIHKYTSEY